MASTFDVAVDKADGVAWGQFLDTSKNYHQIGPYGTMGGLMALSAAQRTADPLCVAAVKRLEKWFRFDGSDDTFFQQQTVRLAMCNMVARLVGEPGAVLQGSVDQAIRSRALSNGLWGNYWKDASALDSTPRIIPSALIILGGTLRAPKPGDDTYFRSAAASLQDLALTLPKVTPLEASTTLAALLSAQSLSKEGARHLLQFSPWMAALSEKSEVYFFDYECGDKARPYRRDYFIGFPSIFLAIAGTQPDAPGALKLRAEDTLAQLATTVQETGFFRPRPSDRISSLDNGWVALALSQGLSPETRVRRRTIMKYWLLRERNDNRLTKALPIIAFVATFLGPAISVSAKEKFFSALCAALWGTLYGTAWLRRILRVDR